MKNVEKQESCPLEPPPGGGGGWAGKGAPRAPHPRNRLFGSPALWRLQDGWWAFGGGGGGGRNVVVTQGLCAATHQFTVCSLCHLGQSCADA